MEKENDSNKTGKLSFFSNLKNSFSILYAFMRNKEDRIGKNNVYNSFLRRYLGGLLQKFIDIFSSSIALLNKDYEIIYLNQVFGHYIKEGLGKIIFEVISEIKFSPTELKQKFADLDKNEKPKIDFTHILNEGDSIKGYDFSIGAFEWGRVRYVFIFNDTSVNLTNIKKLNQKDFELKLEKEKKDILTQANAKLEDFKLALDNSSDSIIIVNKEGNIEYVNQGFIKNTGYSKKEALGQNSIELQSCDPENKIYDEIKEKLSNGKTWSGELKNRKKNQEEFWERVTITPIFNDKNEIYKFVSVKKDITEEKKIQENLVSSYEKLLELDRRKDDFISIASHELRTPMTVIKGYASLLEDEILGQLNGKQKSYSRKIIDHTDHLIELVNDMLDLNKLESGKMDLKLNPCEIQSFLDRIQDDFAVMYKEKNIELKYQTEINKDKVLADENKIMQVFNNLLRNAFKFTNNNGKVEILITELKEENNIIEFRVKDNGIGIPEDKIESIFNKFSQVDNHLQRDHEGTGLGLAIVKKIIENHQGTISVESQEGKGSIFIFTLPKA